MLYNVNCEGVNVFVRESLKYVWLMKVQDPPMVFLWADTQVPIDKSRFTFYTQRGETVVQTVWPAVLLHEAGPLMSKGIVQAEWIQLTIWRHVQPSNGTHSLNQRKCSEVAMYMYTLSQKSKLNTVFIQPVYKKKKKKLDIDSA